MAGSGCVRHARLSLLIPVGVGRVTRDARPLPGKHLIPTMTTTATATPETTTVPTPAAPVQAAQPKAKKAKVKAAKPAATTEPQPNPARDKLHGEVSAMIESVQGKRPDERLVVLRKAMETVRLAVPDVPLSENKEQRGAQLKALREARAAMGTQVLARIIGDAIAATDGATQTRRFSARMLTNGALSAVESITTRLKGASTFRGYSVR